MSLLNLFQWLEGTPPSVAIRESTLLFPVIEGTHVLALALSVGTIVVLDLRLVGWGMRGTPVSRIFEQLRPWSLFGFGLMFSTGLLGEVLIRTYFETQDRRIYAVRQILAKKERRAASR